MSDVDQELKRLSDLNVRLCLIIGYMSAFINDIPKPTVDQEKYKWIMKAIENVLYLDKPLPQMP